MKRLYHIILSLCLLAFSTGITVAQTCSSSFTVSTSSTPSTCQANGTVTVTLGGDLTNISNVQYGLTSTTTGFTINPQENNVLSNIPSGTYNVSVRAFCAVDANYNVVKTVSNVTVGGNYKVPTVSFNTSASRKSYDVCNTGIVVLNVTDGSGTFTFNITSAPAGTPTGPVTPIKTGTTYKFPTENYPAGNYTVQVQDGCYTSVASFTLGQITGYPTFTYTTYPGVRPTLNNNDCSNFNWYAGTVSGSNPDYYRYYTDGMYEVGAARAGDLPTTWVTWNNYMLLLNTAPYVFSDFYNNNSLNIYTRVKGCTSGYNTLLLNMKKPSIYNSSNIRNCDNYSYTVTAWTDYDGMFCYPVSLKITQTSGAGTGTVLLDESNMSNPASRTVLLDYGNTYTSVMTDASGTTSTISVTPTRGLMSLSYVDNNCSNQYTLNYNTVDPCFPVQITIKDPSNNVVHSNTLNSTASTSVLLNYGVAYTFEAVYVGTTPLRTYTTTINKTSGIPTGYSMSLSSANNCIEDNGQLYISRQGSGYIQQGTTFTVTGPAGYTTQTTTITGTGSTALYLPSTTLPAGTYTLTAIPGCGDQTPLVTTINLNGVYSGKTLAYTSENTCPGLKITPSGLITYQGVNTTTYYRLTSGPSGFDQTVRAPGGSFILSTPGTYTLGIMNTNSATGCAIKTLTINYTAPPMALSQNGTSAYECVNGTTGVILLQAINGVAPYTYQLWNKANTVKLVPTDITSSGQVHFSYGQADSTYTARISDVCGNSFSQRITMAKLTTARIVYTNDANICYNDTIRLQCITLGNTAYNWTGPNNYTSTQQNPKIGDARPNMTGWYKVSVKPEFCGDPVQDSIYIQVYNVLAGGTTSPNQAVCVRTSATALSVTLTGGSTAYTYQWQSSPNGASSWTNISLATSATYTPPIQTQSGPRYYRVIVTDKCGTITSNSVTVNSTPCFIPVNPNLRSRGGK